MRLAAPVDRTLEENEPQASTTSLTPPSAMIFAKVAWEEKRYIADISSAAPIFAKDQWEAQTSSEPATATSLIFANKRDGVCSTESPATASVPLASAIFAKEAWEFQKRDDLSSREVEPTAISSLAIETPSASLIFAKDAWGVENRDVANATPTPAHFQQPGATSTIGLSAVLKPNPDIFAKVAWETD
ncbi:hypothetical protein D9757_002198 [Collybiopsis confluens]|uniref:Uncharacterized protein n=1 Tax=Collybiopsis confluens TaxID=2823264 RepID=A0A8H5MG54_9AGAR|nr:hypothetical protein D9757_002198 [Collybiopsis confluens]